MTELIISFDQKDPTFYSQTATEEATIEKLGTKSGAKLEKIRVIENEIEILNSNKIRG